MNATTNDEICDLMAENATLKERAEAAEAKLAAIQAANVLQYAKLERLALDLVGIRCQLRDGLLSDPLAQLEAVCLRLDPVIRAAIDKRAAIDAARGQE